MKRKLLITVIAIFATVCAVIAMSGCDVISENHKHALTLVGEKDATCTADGNSAYFVCLGCGKWFEDGDGEIEITDKSSVVRAKGHKLTAVEEVQSTCTEDGNKAYYICSACDEWFEDETCENKISDKSSVVLEKGHKLNLIEEKQATCTEDGNEAYYACDGCGKWFVDKYGIFEIIDKSIVVLPKGHNIQRVLLKSATCTEDGNKTHYACTVCDKLFADKDGKTEIEDKSSVIVPKRHHLISVSEKKATCISEGNKSYYVCGACDKFFEDEDAYSEIKDKESVVLLKSKHDLTYVTAKNTSCSAKGNAAYYSCGVCHKWFQDEDAKTQITDKNSVTITKLPHSYENNICLECGAHKPAGTEGLEYTDKGDYYEVSGIGTAADTDIVIADEYNGKPVRSIGYEAFSGCRDLTSVIIPDSITTISDWAFEDCKSLTSIVIPDSVTSIGKCMLIYCKSLTTVTIPDSVTSIGESMFEDCDNLTTVILPDSITSIGESAFAYCNSLKNINIPVGVTSIGDSAFYYCTSLTSIAIPDSVTYIGASAFEDCYNLEEVTIGVGVTKIGFCAFYDCRNLENIYFNGMKAQWFSIQKGTGWDGELKTYEIHCLDGDISVIKL